MSKKNTLPTLCNNKSCKLFKTKCGRSDVKPEQTGEYKKFKFPYKNDSQGQVDCLFHIKNTD